MMPEQARRRIVEVELPSRNVVLVEATVLGSGGDASTGLKGRIVAVGDHVSEIAGSLLESVRRELPDAPDEVTVEFGVKIATSPNGVFSVLAGVAAEGNVVVKATWKK